MFQNFLSEIYMFLYIFSMVTLLVTDHNFVQNETDFQITFTSIFEILYFVENILLAMNFTPSVTKRPITLRSNKNSYLQTFC